MPDDNKQGRIAVVTGGNRGIGREITRQLAMQGMRVVLTARDRSKGERAVQELGSQGLAVDFDVCDVSDAASITDAVASIMKRFGRIDVLVNNAAVLADDGGFKASIFDMTDATVQTTFASNLLGPVHLMKAVLPGMRAEGYGRIVNISSTAGQLSGMGAGYPAYRLSKTALNAATRIFAAEVREDDVKVNAMCPGWVRTDMGGPGADRSVEEGADTAIWLATLPANGPTGGFFQDRKQIPW